MQSLVLSHDLGHRRLEFGVKLAFVAVWTAPSRAGSPRIGVKGGYNMTGIKDKKAKKILLKQLERLEEVAERAARTAPSDLPRLTEAMVLIAKNF